MQRKFRVWTATRCLAISLISYGLVADGFAADRGPAAGRGGGGGGRSVGGGGGGRSSGRGTIHAPARNGGSAPSARGQSPAPNRTPSFSTPSSRSPKGAPALRSNNPSGGNSQPGVGAGRPNIAQPGTAGALRNNAGNNVGVRNNVGIGNNAGNNVGVRNNVGIGNDTGGRNKVGIGNNVGIGAGSTNTINRVGNTNVGINNQSLGGNTVNLGNRSVNLAATGYRPAYNGHQMYHGYWNGNYGGGNWGYGLAYGVGFNQGYNSAYYNNRYYRPLGWGLGAWGLGRLAYGSGYLGYSNPYYNNGYAGYNYAQPIPVAYSDQSTSGVTTADAALNAAIIAFQASDFDKALDLVNQGIAQAPSDAVLHEFRGLVLFAKGDYQQSAATIHSVLAVGPGWDWTTLSSLYDDVAVYTGQLRALEAAVRNQPEDGAQRFLLAYHYMTAGHTEAAARQLQRVVTLQPNDRVAADLLKMTSKPEPSTELAPQPASDNAASVTPVDPASLVGSWAAARDDGSKFALSLTNDATFTWMFTPMGQKAQEFTGKYTVEGDVLALEGADGGSLVATVIPGTGKSLNFKLLGAPVEDPGLDFTR